MSSAPRTTTVTIREFRPDDAEVVGQLTLGAYDLYGTISGEYRTYLGDPNLRVDHCTSLLVAELDGEVVGTVTFVLPGDRAWEGPREPVADAGFRVLAVAPDVEGSGVGRALVERCIDLAREHGSHRLMIVSMTWMTRAHTLYRKLGFERRPDLDLRFPGGDGLMFQRDLTDQADERFPPPGAVPDELPWFEDVWDR
jgi:predicted N-acetyltransferase YhbS